MGKENVIRQLVIALIAGGTCFWRTFPAQEKTMLLRAFAKSIGGDFKRIQFTPDLLPSYLTGINFFHQEKGGL